MEKKHKRLNHSQSPKMRGFNSTSFDTKFVDKLNDKSRLPALNLTSYQKGSQINVSQSTSVLHFPLKINGTSEATQTLQFRTKKRFSILEQMEDQIFKLRFTSFLQIGEQNHSLINSKSDDKPSILPINKLQVPIQLTNPKGIRCDSQPQHSAKSKSESSVDSLDIGMELEHNKMMYKHLSHHQKNDQKTQIKFFNDQILKDLKEQKMQLNIRKLPSLNKTKNLVGSLHQLSQPDKFDAPVNVTKSRRKISIKGLKQLVGTNTMHIFGTPMAYWYKQEDNNNYKPDFREMACSSSFEKTAFLYGGIGMHVLNDLVQIDLVTFNAKKLPQNGDKPQNRYAGALHSLPYPIPITYAYSAVRLQVAPLPIFRILIIFAGESSFNSQMKQRECLCDCRVYNLDTGDWKYLRPNSDIMPEPRRSFGSCIVGKGMLVHGGQTNRSNYLNDLYYLNLSQCRWYQVDAIDELYPQGIAFQQMLPIYLKPQNVIIGGMVLEKNLNLLIKKFKLEGVYSFGGCCQDKQKLAQFNLPFLSVLLLHQSPPTWIVPETSGKPPKPRILHCIAHVAQYNSVAVFGGRNDLDDQPYMSDLHLLQLDTLQWVEVKQIGEIVRPRGGHCIFNTGTQLLVLGGLNLKGYLSAQIEKCELDKGIVRHLFDQTQFKNKFESTLKLIEETVITEPEIIIQNPKIISRMTMYHDESEMLQREIDEQNQKRKDMKIQIEVLKYSNFNQYVPEVKAKTPSSYQFSKLVNRHQNNFSRT